MNKSILKKLLTLLAILAVAGWVQTFTSCSSDGGDGDNPSSSSVGAQSGGSNSSGVRCLDSNNGTFTDNRDNKEYKYVTICSQIWMAENLNYNAEGSKCYDDDLANCVEYGRLYSWSTAMGFDVSCNSNSCSNQIQSPHQGICPNGWHLPSQAEWNVMTAYIGGESTEGKKLRTTSGWDAYAGDKNGTDDYGFSAMPGGRGHSDGDFDYIGNNGYWWSINESYTDDRANLRTIDNEVSYADWGAGLKSHLLSIRCLKDGAEDVSYSSGGVPSSSSMQAQEGSSSSSAVQCLDADNGVFTDSRDNKGYEYVIICSQTWMAENLSYEVTDSKCYGDDPANCAEYGRLYSWSTAMDLDARCNSNTCSKQIQTKHRGICPSGWHLPTKAELNVLINYVGSYAGTKLKARIGWKDYYGIESGNGTDDYGFSALPGGYFSDYSSFDDYGYFSDAGNYGYWWSASDIDRDDAYYLQMEYKIGGTNLGYKHKYYRHSVRCVKD